MGLLIAKSAACALKRVQVLRSHDVPGKSLTWTGYAMALLAPSRRGRSAFGPGQATAHFLTVSQVRVVNSVPKVFSISVMNTGPRGPGT